MRLASPVGSWRLKPTVKATDWVSGIGPSTRAFGWFVSGVERSAVNGPFASCAPDIGVAWEAGADRIAEAGVDRSEAAREAAAAELESMISVTPRAARIASGRGKRVGNRLRTVGRLRMGRTPGVSPRGGRPRPCWGVFKDLR